MSKFRRRRNLFREQYHRITVTAKTCLVDENNIRNVIEWKDTENSGKYKNGKKVATLWYLQSHWVHEDNPMHPSSSSPSS